MDTPLFSIIVPVYKAEQYLHQCLDSILRQTFADFQVVLVDDGSPDGSGAICDEYAARDSRITVIHKVNGGQGSARKAAVPECRGAYIVCVDSDDYIAKDMYERLLTALKSGNVGGACCLFYRVSPNGEIVQDNHSFGQSRVVSVKESLDMCFYNIISNALWCKLFKRSVFDGVRLPVGEINEDFPLIVPTFANSGGMALVNEPLYYYRKRVGSVTAGWLSAKNYKVVLKNFALIGEQLEKERVLCQKSYAFFVASGAYRTALVSEKYRDKLDSEAKELLLDYKKIMQKNYASYVFSKQSLPKDKLLYTLVLTNTLRPLYKLLKKSL